MTANVSVCSTAEIHYQHTVWVGGGLDFCSSFSNLTLAPLFHFVCKNKKHIWLTSAARKAVQLIRSAMCRAAPLLLLLISTRPICCEIGLCKISVPKIAQHKLAFLLHTACRTSTPHCYLRCRCHLATVKCAREDGVVNIKQISDKGAAHTQPSSH